MTLGPMRKPSSTGAVVPAPTGTPTAEGLVGYLNRTAAPIQALESRDLAIEGKQGWQSAGLAGSLYCEKPKNFRLRAKAVGHPEADFGSNDTEFWYWIGRDDPPYLYHCDYQSLDRGGVRLPFPFQPDWVMAALGMATYPPVQDGNYRVEAKGNTFELIQRTESQGRPVTRVTIFSNREETAPKPQVVGHVLLDDRGQVVGKATVMNMQRDRATGAVVPHQVKLEWPSLKMSLELTLDGVTVNARTNPQLFARPSFSNIQSYDLARRALDGQPSGLQRTGLR